MNFRNKKYQDPDRFENGLVQKKAEFKSTEGKLSLAEFTEDYETIKRLTKKLTKLNLEITILEKIVHEL